ncbi:MAG: hypothetical protein ACRCXT_06740 [Paraclostridium sp.]
MKNIYVGYDFGTNEIKVANGTTATSATNKGQLDAGILEAKAYTDSKIQNLGEYVGKINPTAGLPTTGSGALNEIDKGDWWYIEAEGNLLGVPVHVGDRLQALINDPDTSDNTSANTGFVVLHTYHPEDGRYTISNLALTANTEKTINHGLGYRFVQVSVADVDGNKVDLDVKYVDESNLKLTSSATVNVWGVISI